MPTPLGHSLVGLAVFTLTADKRKKLLSRENMGLLALCLVAANLPDVDFFHLGNNGLEVSGKHHHGATHSIGFALFIGAAVGLWGRVRGNSHALKLALITAGLIIAHATSDIFCIDTYAINGIGVPILWPLSSEFFMVPLFESMNRDDPFSMKSILALISETAIYGMLAMSAFIWRRKKKTGDTSAG